MNILNDREMLIMKHKANGHTAKEIAKLVGLEYRTVESYIGNIRKKLNARNIAHAIYIVSANKII